MNIKKISTILSLCLMAFLSTSSASRATTVQPPAVDCFKQLQEPMIKLAALTNQVGDPEGDRGFSWGMGDANALIALLRKTMDGSVCKDDAASINFARKFNALELKFKRLQETHDRKAGGKLAHDISVDVAALKLFVMNNLEQ